MSPDKYADKIAKLLRKAESTESQAEAESLVAKAQELMTTYAIDDAMIAKARGEAGKPEKIVEEMIKYTGVYQKPFYEIGAEITRANDCKVLISTSRYGPKTTTLHVVGHESDVSRVKLLDTSLQIQALGAMNRWWKENADDYSWMTSGEKHKKRRGFLFGFADGLGMQLREAKLRGQAEAARMEAERSEVSEEEAKKSVALVVRSRKDKVDDWYDERYGKVRSAVSREYDSGGYDAHGAGMSAGRSADASTGRGMKQTPEIGGGS